MHTVQSTKANYIAVRYYNNIIITNNKFRIRVTIIKTHKIGKNNSEKLLMSGNVH